MKKTIQSLWMYFLLPVISLFLLLCASMMIKADSGRAVAVAFTVCILSPVWLSVVFPIAISVYQAKKGMNMAVNAMLLSVMSAVSSVAFYFVEKAVLPVTDLMPVILYGSLWFGIMTSVVCSSRMYMVHHHTLTPGWTWEKVFFGVCGFVLCTAAFVLPISLDVTGHSLTPMTVLILFMLLLCPGVFTVMIGQLSISSTDLGKDGKSIRQKGFMIPVLTWMAFVLTGYVCVSLRMYDWSFGEGTVVTALILFAINMALMVGTVMLRHAGARLESKKKQEGLSKAI